MKKMLFKEVECPKCKLTFPSQGSLDMHDVYLHSDEEDKIKKKVLMRGDYAYLDRDKVEDWLTECRLEAAANEEAANGLAHELAETKKVVAELVSNGAYGSGTCIGCGKMTGDGHRDNCRILKAMSEG